jgi:hypothetical protein
MKLGGDLNKARMEADRKMGLPVLIGALVLREQYVCCLRLRKA